MKRIFTLTVVGILMICYNGLTAQDIHYSQFYASPLTLNPALTGQFVGTYRINGMYRSQWGQVDGHPFVTPAIGGEFKSLFPKLIKKGSLSVGLIIWNDKSGTGNLRFFNALASLAYEFNLTHDGSHKLSIGAQSGFAQKGLDYNLLTFESQFTGLGFSNIPSGENLNTSYTILPVNAGLAYSGHINKKLDLTGGVGAFNINQPADGFNKQSSASSIIPMRLVGHVGARYKLGDDDKIVIAPNLLYMTQAGAMEICVGGLVDYKLANAMGPANVNPVVFGGIYYRGPIDAVIPTAGLEYNGIRVGLSYDVTISSAHAANNFLGGFEISLIYIGNILGNVVDKQILTCPRF